jgi:hypothetical protein
LSKCFPFGDKSGQRPFSRWPGIARASVTGISAGVEKNRLDCTNRITEGIAADHAPTQAFRW